jgi:hypothetical protein
MKKFFVISLPRTGTKSLCKMAKICGLKYKHVPHLNYENNLKLYDFFSDTPCFVPSFVEKVCKNTDFDANFIYIEKEFDSIYNSWMKVNLYRNYVSLYLKYKEDPNNLLNKSMIFDIESYNESFSNVLLEESNCVELFTSHRDKVFDIIKNYKKKLLIYNFNEGWDSFCNFLECDIPNMELPHININTMFEKID